LFKHASQIYVFLQAQFDAGELITQREVVSKKVSDDLTSRAEQFGVILDDISIVSQEHENLNC
jgi:prohibitin 1